MTIETIRHSLAHIMATAVQELYPGAKFGIGPAIENGFYYDFALPADLSAVALAKVEAFGEGGTITPEDLPKIEKKMRELIKQNIFFKKEKLARFDVAKLFKNQPYKLELIEEIARVQPVSIYASGGFVDLCKGPHIKSTLQLHSGEAKEIIDAFKLTKIAGAYWRGSEKNPMLTRIYGIAFPSKQELDDYLRHQAEKEKRDHRILGEKLELFMIDEKIGKGLPLWLPKGYFIRHLIEDYIYKLELKNGYQHVLTPHLAKEDLYKTSGHLAHYKENMYAPIEIEGERYYLKPMNCPHHHSIYKNKIRSYRDLPLRIAEFGTVYRYERSGVLSGLIRVRGFTQNDAHIYVTPEKLEQEIINFLKLHKKVYEDFKISNYWFRLSLPDFKNKEKFGDIKNKKMWEEGSTVLERVLKKFGVKFIKAEGEATFYGPKIDIQIKNIQGKEDTIATIQVDYYSANKFNLSYIDKDGKEKPVIVIHRAILGSFDRFFAFLLEQTAGAFPVWLAPVQARIIPISAEKHLDYAKKIYNELLKQDIRAELDESNETLGKKIRNGEMQKIPYLLVVGDKEMKAKSVGVRERGKGDIGMMNLTKFLEKAKIEIEKKK
ncbi:threonine--tRNA ligase [Patescibacteria group bacterium]|nr:threonine--tRNA ligase [Patescibacteria group bacterium]